MDGGSSGVKKEGRERGTEGEEESAATGATRRDIVIERQREREASSLRERGTEGEEAAATGATRRDMVEGYLEDQATAAGRDTLPLPQRRERERERERERGAGSEGTELRVCCTRAHGDAGPARPHLLSRDGRDSTDVVQVDVCGGGRGACGGAEAGSESGVHRAEKRPETCGKEKRREACGKRQEACGALGAWMAWMEAEWRRREAEWRRSYFLVSLLGYGVGLACCVCSSASLNFRLAEVERF